MTTINSIINELLNQICIDNEVAISLMKTNKYFFKNVGKFIIKINNTELLKCNTVIINKLTNLNNFKLVLNNFDDMKCLKNVPFYITKLTIIYNIEKSDYYTGYAFYNNMLIIKKFKKVEYLCFKNFKNIYKFYQERFNLVLSFYDNFKYLNYLKLLNSSVIFYTLNVAQISKKCNMNNPIHLYHSGDPFYKISPELINRIYQITLESIDNTYCNDIENLINLEIVFLKIKYKKNEKLVLCKNFVEQIFNFGQIIKLKLLLNNKEIDLHNCDYIKKINILTEYNISIQKCINCSIHFI